MSRKLVANHLSIPESVYGRLVLLASLRGPRNGRSSDSRLSDCLERDDFNRAVRVRQKQVFAEWLNLTLERQSADLTLYLSGTIRDGPAALRSRQRLILSDSLLPDSATESERELFLCDLRVITALVENEHALEWRIGQPSSIRPDHRVITMMREARKQHGNVQLSLGRLGERLRTCDRQLGRLFKKCTGLAFREYLRNVRMLEARTRLLGTSQSVQQVALALGYEDSANFSHDFKRRTGLCPVEFRRSHASSF